MGGFDSSGRGTPGRSTLAASQAAVQPAPAARAIGKQTLVATAPAIQRHAASGALVSATEYLTLNARVAGDAIMRHLRSVTLATPHPRLAWRNLGAFYQRLFKRLDRIVYVFDNPTDLAQLVYPQDPYAVIDAVRPIAGVQGGVFVGSWDWRPSVGTALAQLLEEALAASLHRIGPRWLDIAERAEQVSGAGVRVDPESIPRSHAMDRAVAPALCQPGVLAVLAGPHDAKPRSAAGVGLRPVQYVWLGKETHGELWNWVRATSPVDATVEEVSAQLFSDTADSHGERHGDYLAFAMTAAPPLFGLPGHWAVRFDGGKAYAPARVPSQTDAAEDNLVHLAGSSLADDQALREAGVTPAARPGARLAAGAGAAAAALVQDVRSQATYATQQLAAWGLDGAVGPALAFVGRRQAERADAAKLATWQPVLAGQKARLSRIGAGIGELDRAIEPMGISNKQGPDAQPLRDILRIYADAAGASHLAQTSEALIQRATALQATLPLRGVQRATRELGASADLLRDATPVDDPERLRLGGAASQLDDDARQLQSRLIRGDKVDPDEVDRITVDAGELALESKVHAIAVQLEVLEAAAHAAGDGLVASLASLFSSEFHGLEVETRILKDSLQRITGDMDWQARAAGFSLRVETAHDLEDHRRETMRVRKAALARAQGQYATMAANGQIQRFLSRGASLVKWQAFRTACVKLAALIGVSIVGGALGGLAARGVGGMMMSATGATELAELSLGAQVIARGSGLLAETATTAAGQAAMFGDRLGDAFLENLLMSLGSAGALKAVGHQAETLAQVERASAGLWAKAGAAGKLVLRESAAITGHMIMGVALGYVSHMVVTGKAQPPPATLEDWLLQGASVAVGRYVGKSMAARAATARKLAAIQGFAAGQRLLAATTALHDHALRGETNPQPKQAAELLARRHAVLTDEAAALDELAASPALMKASGLHPGELRRMRTEVRDQLAEIHDRAFAEVPLHLAGLEELIPGAQWTGSRDQIAAAIESARRAGVKLEAKPPQGNDHTWHVVLEGRPLELVEREVVTPASAEHSEHANLARIRNGKLGVIRSEAELGDADVAQSMNAQLQNLQPSQIDALIGRFPAAQRDHARQVLARASGFGRMESLNALCDALLPHLAAGKKLYTPGTGSLADNLSYVSAKRTFKSYPQWFPTANNFRVAGVVILDGAILSEIKSNPAFAARLNNPAVVLIEPRGFGDGINMFNAGTPEAIAARTRQTLDRATRLQNEGHGRLSFEDAITQALDERTHEALAAAHVTGTLTVVDPAAHPDLSSAGIAGQLNSDAGISERDVGAALSMVPEADRAMLRELLAQQSEVYSARRITNELLAQHQQILAMAAQRGISPANVYFLLPQTTKSFGMMAMAHREATGTPAVQYLNGAYELARRQPGPDTMVVVLDDVAGTGETLMKVPGEASSAGYRGHVVISPMVSSSIANDAFNQPNGISSLPNTSYAPGRVLNGIKESPYFNGLAPAQREGLKALLGGKGLGYQDNGLLVAFPYMAPDNNIHMFGDQIAKSFILNQNRHAARTDHWKPEDK